MARPEQTEIPGTERAKHKDVDSAIKNYLEVRDARMELTKKEVEKRTILIDRMHGHGLTAYHWNGYDCKLDAKEKVTVRTSEIDAEAGENED